jgi:hypothetical protein
MHIEVPERWGHECGGPLALRLCRVDEQTARILVCFHLALVDAVKSVDSTSHLEMRTAFASLTEATHDVCAEF